MMWQAILSGLGFGLMLAMVPGPVFFALIQTGIARGFKYGVLFALGVALSDVAFIGLTYYGVSAFLDDRFVRKLVGLAGGLVMMIFGAFYFFRGARTSATYEQINRQQKGGVSLVIKGFVLNILNPFVFFFWVGMVSVISIEFGSDERLIFTFFIASVVMVFYVDVFKSFISNIIKRFFTGRFMLILNRALGVILAGVGIRLIYKALTDTLLV